MILRLWQAGLLGLLAWQSPFASGRLHPESLVEQQTIFHRSRDTLAINAGRFSDYSAAQNLTSSELSCLITTPSYDTLNSIDEYWKISQLTKREPHKRLLPLSKGDIIGFVLTILVLFIAAGGGIGGGGAIIPLYLLFLGFDAKVAVALGNITIVGGSLSNFVFNAPRRHAFLNRPLIDWDLILVMEPSTILGALIGGYINKALPSWMTTVLLAVLLTFISYKLLTRGYITWHTESLHAKQAKLEEAREPLLSDRQNSDDDGASEEISRSVPLPAAKPQPTFDEHSQSHSPMAYTSSLSGRGKSFIQGGWRDSRNPAQDLGRLESNEEEEDGSNADDDLDDVEPLPEGAQEAVAGQAARQEAKQDARQEGREGGEHEPLLAEGADREQQTRQSDSPPAQEELQERFAERRQLPPVRLGIMVLLTIIVALTDYFKGKVECGSWKYWLLVLAIIPFVLLVTLFARHYLLEKRKIRKEAGYSWQEGDVEWTPKSTLLYPAVCSIAGLVAGMFGVGGGIVKGPLMLELGVLPDVASATSATMIVFTSASASIVFLSFGGIPMNYALTVFIIGIIFTMLGQIACYVLMRALGRRSVIIFAMAALMVLSMVVTYYEAIAGIIAAVNGHRLWRFGRICA